MADQEGGELSQQFLTGILICEERAQHRKASQKNHGSAVSCGPCCGLAREPRSRKRPQHWDSRT